MIHQQEGHIMIWMELHLVIIHLLQLEKVELYVPPQIMDRLGIMEHQEQQDNCMKLPMGPQHLSLWVKVGLISIQVTTEVHGVPGLGVRMIT